MKARELLQFKNWLVVGDVKDPDKYAAKIYGKLKEEGFVVHAFHPLDEGMGVYTRFEDIDFPVEVLNLVVNPKRGLEIVMEAKEHGIKMVLAQPGARSRHIRKFCKENDMVYIKGCALVELSYI